MRKILLLLLVSISAVAAMAGSSGTANAATATSVIDFEGLPTGFVSSVSYGSGISGDPVTGSVSIFGVNPLFAGTNVATIFDATCGGGTAADCTGNDDDLFKPELGKVAIINEDLDATDPDDSDARGVEFQFDFSGLGTGTVTVNSLNALDVEIAEGEDGANIELYSGGPTGTLLDTVAIPPTGNNGLSTIIVGVSGVDFMRVILNGSGAIDNISITTEVPDEENGGEGCTPGYWKQPHHFGSWVGYSTTDSFETVFGVDASFDLNLLGALQQGGGGEKALGRHAVAALLNAANADVSYAYTEAQIIALVQEAYATGDFNSIKDLLETENELGCPLGRAEVEDAGPSMGAGRGRS